MTKKVRPSSSSVALRKPGGGDGTGGGALWRGLAIVAGLLELSRRLLAEDQRQIGLAPDAQLAHALLDEMMGRAFTQPELVADELVSQPLGAQQQRVGFVPGQGSRRHLAGLIL